MLQTNSASEQYVIKIISQDNPIKIKLPIVPSKVIESQSLQVLTIDDFTFTTTKPVNYLTNSYNHINAQCDFVKLMFNNGTGCFDQTGRQTKLLQILTPVTQITDINLNMVRKTWRLIGGTDPFLWTFGHDLQIGFTDFRDTPIDFGAATLNTYYTIIIQIHMV